MKRMRSDAIEVYIGTEGDVVIRNPDCYDDSAVTLQVSQIDQLCEWLQDIKAELESTP